MNLYDGYCYSTIDEAAQSELSSAASVSSNGLVAPVSYTVSGDTATLTFNYQAFSAGAPVSYAITRVYPSCSSLGYQHNFTGLTLADVNQSSWAVVAVWVAVWAVKYLRRAS